MTFLWTCLRDGFEKTCVPRHNDYKTDYFFLSAHMATARIAGDNRDLSRQSQRGTAPVETESNVTKLTSPKTLP